MSNSSRKGLGLTTFINYLTFVLAGIDMSILAQYKTQLALQWTGKATDVASAYYVIGAIGLGGLISSIFTGPISDFFGHRLSALIGDFGFVIFAFGIIWSPTQAWGYFFAMVCGIANSFMSASVIPVLIDTYPESGSVVTMMTKFFVSAGQFLLPVIMWAVAKQHMSFHATFWLLGIVTVIAAVFYFFVKFPNEPTAAERKEWREKQKAQREKNKAEGKASLPVTAEAISIMLIGFTSFASFNLWANCYQELATSYGVAQPQWLQQIYAVASLVGVLFNSFIVKKGFHESYILIIYPLITAFSLLLALIHSAGLLYVVAGLIGFFAASGLMQLATALMSYLYPDYKGTTTSLVSGLMVGLASYGCTSIAGWMMSSLGAQGGPRAIIIFNVVITLIGSLLACIVRHGEKKREAETANK